jgi:hypothetical protein
VTEGVGIRITITVLTALQAGIAALLALELDLAIAVKAGLVVASAMLAVVLNQVPSWQSAPAASRALQERHPE